MADHSASSAAPAPWMLTRNAFHAGKNLHGSARDPRLVPSSAYADRSGFFTTAEESHADFYANSAERNYTPNVGDIYAAEPPQRPLDLGTNHAAVRDLVAWFRRHADAMNDAFLDGKRQTSPGRFVRAVEALERVARSVETEGAPRHLLDSALRNAAIEMAAACPEKRRPNGHIVDASALNDAVRALGFDAFITDETNPATGQRVVVTVYVDRPPLVSHRQAVLEALDRGEPVPAEVLADYPDLAARAFRGSVRAQHPDHADARPGAHMSLQWTNQGLGGSPRAGATATLGARGRGRR